MHCGKPVSSPARGHLRSENQQEEQMGERNRRFDVLVKRAGNKHGYNDLEKLRAAVQPDWPGRVLDSEIANSLRRSFNHPPPQSRGERSG
jgi:hypothetical protein